MAKKSTRLEKSSKIISNAKSTQWCYVDTENEFSFNNKRYIVDKSVEEYKVYNKSFEVEDYTNDAYMEEILVVIDKHENMRFYNQSYDHIADNLVKSKV